MDKQLVEINLLDIKRQIIKGELDYPEDTITLLKEETK